MITLRKQHVVRYYKFNGSNSKTVAIINSSGSLNRLPQILFKAFSEVKHNTSLAEYLMVYTELHIYIPSLCLAINIVNLIGYLINSQCQ